MKLADEFYSSLETIRWFSTVGVEVTPSFDFGTQHVRSLPDALDGFKSHVWLDAKTEAQGDLTGHLAKTRYDLYGGNWNKTVKASRAVLERTARDAIAAGLVAAGLPIDWLDAVLLDVNRAALEAAFGSEVRSVPRFFRKLMCIYEAGRLPCGWTGDLPQWPIGDICVY